MGLAVKLGSGHARAASSHAQRRQPQADRSKTRHSCEVGSGLSHTCRTDATEILAVAVGSMGQRNTLCTVEVFAVNGSGMGHPRAV
jgi:hypothetical protein